MKKTILIGAIVAIVTATAFVYTHYERVIPQPSAVSSSPVFVPTGTQAVIKIGENTYSVDVTPGETVIETMRALSTAGTLTFAGRDYPGLGFFVDSINGQKNEGGKYWVFYVNGVSATSGVSMYRVTSGDVIEWKYEKGY